MGEEEKTKESHKTKLEAFLAKKGKLFVKDIHSLGTLDGKQGSKMEFAAVAVYEPGQEDEKAIGLKIEITGVEQFKQQGTSFLDIEEIESLSKAMDYMVTLSSKWEGTHKEYSEVIFTTKGGFNVGFYQMGSKQGGFAASGNVTKFSCFFLSLDGLSSVKSVADQGLEWLRLHRNHTNEAEQRRPERQEIGPSPWDTLAVPRGASQDVISRAYHRMADMYHPDKVAGLGPEFREIAERRMKEINLAYQELKTSSR
jgi:hypothetical protein